MTTNNEIGYYWDEALPDIIPEVEWSSVSPSRWDIISDHLNENVSNSRDFMAPVPSSRAIQEMNDAPEISRLKSELAKAQDDIAVFVNSVKRRLGASEVYIQYGEVRYRKQQW